MSTLVTQSKLFGNMFSTPEMRALFSDEAIVQKYIDVEVALARAEARLGIIPDDAAKAIADAADIGKVDWERMATRTEIVGYPILPLVQQMVEWAGDPGQYTHWGATTQDIMDTADVLQARDALNLVEADLNTLCEDLAILAKLHRDTVAPGRTHLQHALPITFGYKCATWLSALDRNRERLNELKPRLLVGQFSGAAGTLASLGDQGLDVQRELMKELDLGVPSITWHTARDTFAEVSGLLALITGSIGKIGYDLMLMMQTEVGEAFEPFLPGRGGSSTMPQKRNPIASEMMLAGAKIVREQHSAMLDAMVSDHERATGQWHVEWYALPSAFVVTSGALRAARDTLAGLDVRVEQMRANLDITGGLIVAEAVMMGLAPKMGREHAHDVVYGCCRKCLETGENFLDALMAEPSITAIASREELEALTDPGNYTGSAGQMVTNYLASRLT